MTRVEPPAGSGFFNDQPFANNILEPNTHTTAGAGADVLLGPFDCTGFQGARHSYQCTGGGGAVLVRLTWFDDLTTAQTYQSTLAVPAGAVCAERHIVMGPASTGAIARFLAPHPADYLVVRFTVIDAGTLDVTWQIAHRQQVAALWIPQPSVVLGTFLQPSVLSQGVNVAFPVGTSNLGGQSAFGIYAGPAQFWSLGPAAATQYFVFVQARDQNNVFQTIFEAHADANGLINQPFLMPPCGPDIRIHAVNNSGGASTLSWTLVADDWRTG